MRKNTLALIRIMYFQHEQVEALRKMATIKNIEQELDYLQSNEFLGPYAERVESEFSSEEIEELLRIYSSSLFQRYMRSQSVLLDLFFNLKKKLMIS